MRFKLLRFLVPFLAFLVAACSSLVNAQTWTLHGPSSRHSHSAVWDPNSAQMIIFGGQESASNTDLNDVWLGKTSTNQDDSFSQELPTGTAPAGRYGHVATYDSVSNRMTIFGGALGLPSPCANDVWILSSANGRGGVPSWSQLSPSGTAPVARLYSGGAYDPNTNSMMIFGGNNCSTGYFNDVWVLSNANGEGGSSAWTQLTPSGTPPAARESGTAVYDSTNNILMIYGGDAGGAPFGDVWILSNANGTGGTPVWTQLSPTGTAPMARTGQTAIYDSVNDRMTIFGGVTSGITLTDSWVLTFANAIGGTPAWVQIATQGTAPSLAYHSAVYDSKLDNMYVFAGSSSADKLATNDHAFTLSGANGISSKGFKWFLGGPPVRYSHSAFYDSVTNGLFVFAGAHATTLLFNDYWEAVDVIGSSNLDWVQMLPKGTKPSPRWGHTGLYDSTSNRLMIFAGATAANTCVNDYHVLENANNKGGTMTWLAVTPTGTAPAIRTRHASVYVPSTNQLIIFGGYSCKTTYYNDVWILSNANDLTATPSWQQLVIPGTKPTARESSSAVYDPTTNSLIVYGGDKGGAPTGDIWILSNADGSGGTPAWTELTPSNNGPVARSGHTATYDSVNNVMTIYAGSSGAALLSDAWVLSGANGTAGAATWTQLPSGQIRRFQSSEYDPTSDQMITFGGATGLVPQDPSSDLYTLTDANDLP
jgi:galactose oxidase-like protein